MSHFAAPVAGEGGRVGVGADEPLAFSSSSSTGIGKVIAASIRATHRVALLFVKSVAAATICAHV